MKFQKLSTKIRCHINGALAWRIGRPDSDTKVMSNCVVATHQVFIYIYADCVERKRAHNTTDMASSSREDEEKPGRIERTIKYHLHSLQKLSEADPVVKYARPKPSDDTTELNNIPKNITDDMKETFENACKRMRILRLEIEVIGMISTNILGTLRLWMDTINEAIEGVQSGSESD